ncbi:aspartyl/asparaginyl beta-hydroxylase domain-containing protein [Maricaulis virginensis]|uniref:Aspartyl/asparaginy/proline hydroxylase domain-containing protein n=1 Tax=Maricaulis virginensis TaxID=144022 RepID=A0A9W6MMF0_9PROT|nr:aspartyl/asparaginyl beta-hydroxylase domain-containing protein [Maricaulis virginensis]GLK50744.1 hypothetical protein GCM10017621_02520 [Maricaulis virginensis]
MSHDFKKGVRTQRISTVAIDISEVKREISLVDPEDYKNYYTEYSNGGWRTCMLANQSGDADSHRIEASKGGARLTRVGNRLTYLTGLISNWFDRSALVYARLIKTQPGSIVFPHRDYLDFEGELVRIHIPLKTNSRFLHSESDLVFHMKQGEVWYLDATNLHAAANLGRSIRYALVLDFHCSNHITDCLRDDNLISLRYPDSVHRREYNRQEIVSKLRDTYAQSGLDGILYAASALNFSNRSHAIQTYDWVEEVLLHRGDEKDLRSFNVLKQKFLFTG